MSKIPKRFNTFFQCRLHEYYLKLTDIPRFNTYFSPFLKTVRKEVMLMFLRPFPYPPFPSRRIDVVLFMMNSNEVWEKSKDPRANRDEEEIEEERG